MNRNSEICLLETYPWLYGNPGAEDELARHGRIRHLGLIDGGFACGDGWYGILERLSRELDAIRQETGTPFRAVQVKEKFGTLRFHLADLSGPAAALAMAAVRAAEAESATTCEICGEPGELMSVSGWYSTLCVRHGEDERARRPGRDDGDGMD